MNTSYIFPYQLPFSVQKCLIILHITVLSGLTFYTVTKLKNDSYIHYEVIHTAQHTAHVQPKDRYLYNGLHKSTVSCCDNSWISYVFTSPCHMYIISRKLFPYQPNIDIDFHNDMYPVHIDMTWFRFDLHCHHQMSLLHTNMIHFFNYAMHNRINKTCADQHLNRYFTNHHLKEFTLPRAVEHPVKVGQSK